MEKEITIQEVMEAVTELHSTFDSKTLDYSEIKERTDKINKFLDKQEDINQKQSLAEAQSKKEYKEMVERCDALKLVLLMALLVKAKISKNHLNIKL